MASRRIAWLMAPPSLAALATPSAQAVALSGQWPPMSRRLIVRYPTGLRQERDFMGGHPKPLRSPRTANAGSADLLCMMMPHIQPSSYKEGSSASLLLMALGSSPGPARRPADFLSAPPQLGRALRQS